MRRITLLLVLLALALTVVASGCGGSDSESSGTTTDTTTLTDTTTEETTTGEATDETDLSGVLADEDCLALASVGATFAQAISGATDEEAAEAFQKLADEVPDEIKADVQILADWFAEYTAKLKDIGIEAGQTPSADQLQQLQAAIAATNQDELTAASQQRLEAWTQENCTG